MKHSLPFVLSSLNKETMVAFVWTLVVISMLKRARIAEVAFP